MKISKILKIQPRASIVFNFHNLEQWHCAQNMIFLNFGLFVRQLWYFFQKYSKYKSRASKCFWNQVNPLLHRGETRIPGIPRIQPDIIPKSPNLRSRILRFSIQKWSEFLKTSITCNFLNFYRISIIFGVLKPDNFSLQKRISFW